VHWSWEGAIVAGLSGGAAAAILSIAARPKMRRVRWARLKAYSYDFDCGIRLVYGTAAGVSSRWRHGPARFEKPGRLVLGALPPSSRERVVIEIAEIDLEGRRRTRLAELFRVNLSAVIIPLRTTSGAELEIAVLPDRVSLLGQGVPDLGESSAAD
jgi:hypothetical protein